MDESRVHTGILLVPQPDAALLHVLQDVRLGKDKVTSSNLQPNDEVQIKFSVEARESSTGRWFNEVRVSSLLKKQPDGTFLSPQGLQQGPTASSPDQGGTSAQPSGNEGTEAEKSDLPF